MKIISFGIAKDILHSNVIEFHLEEKSVSVRELKQKLCDEYPDLSRLSSLAIAVNMAFAEEDTLVHQNDEVALIPPVSGG